MSKQSEEKLKRFFVKLAPDMHRELRVLAATADVSVEIIGGELLTEAIKQRLDAAKRGPKGRG